MRARYIERQDDSGLTLIEMLVAIVILGVIFAGAANFLINSSRLGLINEQRVLATAVLSQTQEELQGLAWDRLALYGEELSELEALDGIDIEGLDLDATPPTFDDREIVLLPGPDNSTCVAVAPECGRRAFVPVPTSTIPRDRNDYQVARIVTWIDRSEDAATVDAAAVGDVKRITTIVAWQVAGRWSVEQFDSERAATAAEAGDPTRARMPLYQVGPETSRLRSSSSSLGQTNVSPIQITARFNAGVSAGDASVRFHALNSSGVLQPHTIVLTGSVSEPDTGKFLAFEATIPPDAFTFPTGSRPFKITAATENGSITSSREIGFVAACVAGTPDPIVDPGALGPLSDPDGGGGSPAEPPDCSAVPAEDDVEITGTTLLPSVACVDADNLLDGDVTVTATVKGMDPLDFLVVISYVADGRTRTEQLLPPGGEPSTIQSSGTVFERIFPAGRDAGFRPTPGSDEITPFVVTATRGSDSGFATESSGVLTVGRC